MVLLVDGDTGMIESLDINTPGTNLENVEKGVIDEDQLLLATTYRKW
jgi:translation initiation factor 2 gamma subunit (eIF-2gamma)